MGKILLLLALIPQLLVAQNLTADNIKKIDSVFSKFNFGTPGASIAVMQNGEVIFEKGYGMANLEYNIPITPQTIFHIASVSKQYAAFCMLLLEQDGKLSVDDDIRKYLPYVPDFGKKITIRQLINHTSGLRDQWALLANAGWQLDDVITTEHVVKLVSKQRGLNFDPGAEYLYCNTGYTLLGEIVLERTGRTLRQFTDERIFKPLGMTRTHFHDNYRELVPGRSYSYSKDSTGKYQLDLLSYSIVGATSLFTTVEDELKWLHNYETGQVGGKALIERMYQVGVLNDGRKLNYAFGISIDQFNGWKEIAHSGGDAGFRTYAARYPEKNLEITVFSNYGDANPIQLTHKVVEILVPEKIPIPETAVLPVADSSFHKRMQGRFYSERGNAIQLVWKNAALYEQQQNGPATSPIQFTTAGNNRFPIKGRNHTLILESTANDKDSIPGFLVETQNNIVRYKRRPVQPQKITSEFAGRYYGAETEAFYTVVEKAGALFLEHRKYSTVPLTPFAPDQFTTSFWWMNHIHFLRNSKGKITGFEVNSGRLQHLRYDLVK